MDETNEVLHLCIDGIRSIEHAVPLAEAVHNLAVIEGPASVAADSERSLAQTRARASLARREVQAGFPLLHAHTLAGVWGSLEAAIEDLAVGILEHDSTIRSREAVAKIKIGLAEFEQLDQSDRMRTVIGELQRTSRADQRLGVGAFEVVFAALGFSGSVSEDVRRNVLEFQQLRHVIVHCGSIADRRLVSRCPWLELRPGQKVRITHAQFARLVATAIHYFADLVERVREKYGIPKSQVPPEEEPPATKAN
ncbi:MAG: hypothetical protein IPK07_35135 [Deltaproteobacteria bacterium]|nr:hypothetical protein [Deltaproteobacteria bacterium]